MKRPVEFNECVNPKAKDMKALRYKQPSPHAYSANTLPNGEEECWYCGGSLKEHQTKVDCSTGKPMVVPV